ncbi:hypothetical protein WICPIJ_009105, partial [Wickerhamomyces pijperi]
DFSPSSLAISITLPMIIGKSIETDDEIPRNKIAMDMFDNSVLVSLRSSQISLNEDFFFDSSLDSPSVFDF